MIIFILNKVEVEPAAGVGDGGNVGGRGGLLPHPEAEPRERHPVGDEPDGAERALILCREEHPGSQ